MIICRTPFRVSFFGGGTDMPKWFNNNNGQVINASINKYGYIYFTNKDDVYDYKFKIRYYLNEEAKNIESIKHPVVKCCLKYYGLSNKTLHITYDSDLPARSGLGSSSSFTAGLINTINFYKNKRISKKNLAKQTIFMEQVLLKETVGLQDQIATSYGGLNHIEFKKNNFFVKKISLENKKIKQLNESILLCYTGQYRFAYNIEKVKNSRIYKNKKIYEEIDLITNEALKLLYSKNNDWLKQFGNLLNDYWQLKKSLDKNVSNKLVDNLYSSFINEGIYGAKLMGAGNGGFILIIANKNVQKKIIKKFCKLKFVKIMIENSGSKIIYPY
tara:strand:- start:8065 stop:9051 length:987 start_codon:yes stop_codon:yes gene_type:complete